MGFGRLNDEQNQPVPLQNHGQGAFQTREGGVDDSAQVSTSDYNSSAAHFMPTPMPNVWPAISSCENVHGVYQTYPYDSRVANNLMTGVIRHNYLQSPQVDPSFSTFGGNAPRHPRALEMSYHEGKIGEICRSIDKNNMFIAGGLRKVDSCSSGLHYSQVNENVVPIRSNTAGGYQRNVWTGEAEGSSMNWSEAMQSSLNLGCDAAMSFQNTNIVQAGVNDNIKVSPFHAGKVDGSFLTLGIGNNPEARSKMKFDPQEVANKLGEAVGTKSSSSYIQPTTSAYTNLSTDFSSFNSSLESWSKMKFNHREFPSKLEETIGPGSIGSSPQPATSVYPNFTTDFSSFNSNPVAFVDPMSNNIGGWTFPHNEGVTQAAAANPYFRLNHRETFKHHDIFENACSNSASLDMSVGRHSTSQSHTSQDGPSPSSCSLNNAHPYLPQPGYTKPSGLTLEASKHTGMTSQPTRDLFGISHSRNTGDITSSFGNNSGRDRGSAVTRDYLGQLSSAEGVHSVCTFGNRPSCLQTAESSANKPAPRSPFPRRLGVQLNEASAAAATQSSNQSLLSMNVGAQTRSNVYQAHNSRPPQAGKYLLGPISGHHQAPLLSHSNLQKPSISTGQSQLALPPQIVDLPRGVHTSGQVLTNRKVVGPSQVYNRVDQQSLKRKAAEPPAVFSWGQKRRLITVPHHYKAGMPTGPTPQIRWTGFDTPPPEPIGQRCLICKRDLCFAPEGLLSQPGNPPAVAVLPCGHTFHDHCLQIITPDNQAHDPPCIPCAIGET